MYCRVANIILFILFAHHSRCQDETTHEISAWDEFKGPPISPTYFTPDFIFDYGIFLNHTAGIGSLPPQALKKRVAIVGAGLSGLVTAYEVMRLGLQPVVYEANPQGRLGGRMRSKHFAGYENTSAVGDMGPMRYDRRSFSGVFYYVNKLGIKTAAFPDPSRFPITPSLLKDTALPDGQVPIYNDGIISDTAPVDSVRTDIAWTMLFRRFTKFEELLKARVSKDFKKAKEVWNAALPEYDFYTSNQFAMRSGLFLPRDIFTNFGNGQYDLADEWPVADLLRQLVIEATADFRRIVGGCQEIANRLWRHEMDEAEVKRLWGRPVSLESFHEGGKPRHAAVGFRGLEDGRVEVEEVGGVREVYDAAVYTGQFGNLGAKVAFDENLVPKMVLDAARSVIYTEATKLFVLVDRPFWRDVDPATGRMVLSTTMSDKNFKSMYIIESVIEGEPSVLALTYTWGSAAQALRGLSLEQRLDIALREIAKIYPNVDIRSHIIAPPIGVLWSEEPFFLGGYNNPGTLQYGRHRALHIDFARNRHAAQPDTNLRVEAQTNTTRPIGKYGFFLAGSDASWGAWSEASLATGVNAVWGIMNYLGGKTHAENPGPGDVVIEWGPADLPVWKETCAVPRPTNAVPTME